MPCVDPKSYLNSVATEVAVLRISSNPEDTMGGEVAPRCLFIVHEFDTSISLADNSQNI